MPERYRSQASTSASSASWNFRKRAALAESVIERYKREEIDAVYVVFNEFKSVIAQRLIVEQILPIEQVGEQAVRLSEEMTEEEKKRAKEAAISAGVGLRSGEHSSDRVAAQFGTRRVDYIYEQPPEELFRALLPKYVAIQIFRCAAGISGSRTCGAHDRDGFCHEQRHGHDRLADAGDEPGAAGEDHERDYRDRQRRSSNVDEAAQLLAA